jgi:hypothetical protein
MNNIEKKRKKIEEIEKKRKKIEEIEKKLSLTEDDLRYIKNQMKEYYGKYDNEINKYSYPFAYQDLKSKINKITELNKTNVNEQRRVVKFKQDIYKNELRKIITFLLLHLEDFLDFESIMLFVAKRRQIIEFLKLEIANHVLFGKFRVTSAGIYDLYSPFIQSKASHLINKLINKTQIKYKNNDLTKIKLDKISNNNSGQWIWNHTSGNLILKLLDKMNKIYEEFKRSLLHKNNKETSKNLLSKLYWLYMQTCPFERGSASIGEIIFSALLQKYFDCDFKLFKERFSPQIIPDIHALTYTLEYFQSIFWDKFVSCENYKNNFSRDSNWNNYMNKRGPDF